MEALLGAGVAGVGLWLARLEPFVALPLVALAFLLVALVAVAVGVALAAIWASITVVNTKPSHCGKTRCLFKPEVIPPPICRVFLSH